MSISTATFSQWYTALGLVFANAGVTIETIDKDKLREKFYDLDFTPHKAMERIVKMTLAEQKELYVDRYNGYKNLREAASL